MFIECFPRLHYFGFLVKRYWNFNDMKKTRSEILITDQKLTACGNNRVAENSFYISTLFKRWEPD